MKVRGKRGGGMRGEDKDSFGLGKREHVSMAVMARMKSAATTSFCPHKFLWTRTLDGTALFGCGRDVTVGTPSTGVLNPRC